jgi:S1-C subfamily serine protease
VRPWQKKPFLSQGSLMENPLIALSIELAAAAERAGRSVVAVNARWRNASSGVIWRNGVIVTADHTVRREEEIRVTLPDGRSAAAELAGRDPGTDLAVLKVETADAPIARSSAPDSIKAGNLALAIGRSEQTGVSAAMGVVSNVSGPWHTWRGGKLDRFLRLDIGLYPGVSGAAVVDAEGKLIGIATAGLSRTSLLAIPEATIDRVTDELLRQGHIARGYLGVGLQPIPLPEHLRTKLKSAEGGLIVLSVEPDGPAGQAGVLIGDVLIAMDGTSVTGTDDVQEFLSGDRVGKPLTASLLRGGDLVERTIAVAERPRRRA